MREEKYNSNLPNSQTKLTVRVASSEAVRVGWIWVLGITTSIFFPIFNILKVLLKFLKGGYRIKLKF